MDKILVKKNPKTFNFQIKIGTKNGEFGIVGSLIFQMKYIRAV